MKLKIVMLCFLCLGSPLRGEAASPQWKEYKQAHFIIYYQNAPKDFIKSVEDSAEDYYNDITRQLGFVRYKGWTWDERAKIYIYDDGDHFRQDATDLSWSSGVALTHRKIIRTFPSAHGFFDSTLPHEMGHLILREFLGPKAQVPVWFEEGVASYQEKARRFGADAQVREAIKDGTFIPLNELSLMRPNKRTDPKKVNLFYAEAASVVRYLITEFGRQRFTNFCRKLQTGKPFDWAFKSAYVRFKTIDKLNIEWLRHLKND